MRRRKLKIVLAAILLLIGVLLIVRVCLPAPPPDLLRRATRLSNVQGLLSYYWPSSEELLVVTCTNGSPATALYSPWSGYIESIDARTGKRTRMDGLSAVITQHTASYLPYGPMQFTQSPGGHWLMWDRLDPRDGGRYPVTARRDGSGYHEWRVPAGSLGKWIDGNRWITILSPSRNLFPQEHVTPENYAPRTIILHDAAHPSQDLRLPASTQEAQALLKQQERLDGNDHGPLLGANPQPTWSSLQLEIMSAPSNTLPGKRADTVSLPPDTIILNNIPNSQGTEIELLVRQNNIPTYVTLLRKLLPHYSYPAHPTENLYIYQADKKELVHLGQVPETDPKLPDIANAFWLPDGKHIQFFYRDAVYIVSAE